MSPMLAPDFRTAITATTCFVVYPFARMQGGLKHSTPVHLYAAAGIRPPGKPLDPQVFELRAALSVASTRSLAKGFERIAYIIQTQLTVLQEAVKLNLTESELTSIQAIENRLDALLLDFQDNPQLHSPKKTFNRIRLLFLAQSTNDDVLFSALLSAVIRIWHELEIDKPNAAQVYRELYFKPEHQQAAIGILSYFSVVLRQKNANVDASISITQTDQAVRLTIDYPDGNSEEVSRTLSEYQAVLDGAMSPEAFLHNPIQALALRNKLEQTELELRQTHRLQELERNLSNQLLISIESEVKFLRSLVSRQLNLGFDINHTFREHLKNSSVNSFSERQIELIEPIVRSIQLMDKISLERNLANAKELEPNLLDRLHSFIYSSVFSGVVGNAAYDWLKVVWPLIPK